MIFPLLIILNILLVALAKDDLKCKCVAAGYQPVLVGYLAADTRGYGACDADMTCTPSTDSGCFSVRDEGKFFSFCGRDEWGSGSSEVTNVKYGLPQLVAVQSCLDLQDTPTGICYCDDRDNCNLPGRMDTLFFNSSNKLSSFTSAIITLAACLLLLL